MGNKTTQPQQAEFKDTVPHQSPNVLIKQQKFGNVPILKQLFHVVHAQCLPENLDSLQVGLVLQSLVELSLTAYSFVIEKKLNRSGSATNFLHYNHISTTQRFVCPASTSFDFPSEKLQFMIIDIQRFQRMKQSAEQQYHTLVLELRSKIRNLPSELSYSLFYFYRIEYKEDTKHAELFETKQVLQYDRAQYLIGTLFGIQNTPFHPKWDPNLTEDKECVICISNFINTVLLPCRHMCTCHVCSDHIIQDPRNKQCPLCRKEIDNYLTLEVKDKERRDELVRQYNKDQVIFNESIAQKQQLWSFKSSLYQEKLKQQAEIQVRKDRPRELDEQSVQSEEVKSIDENFQRQLKKSKCCTEENQLGTNVKGSITERRQQGRSAQVEHEMPRNDDFESEANQFDFPKNHLDSLRNVQDFNSEHQQEEQANNGPRLSSGEDQIEQIQSQQNNQILSEENLLEISINNAAKGNEQIQGDQIQLEMVDYQIVQAVDPPVTSQIQNLSQPQHNLSLSEDVDLIEFD